MALKSRLAIYCYTAPTYTGGGSLVVREYSRELMGLHFTTVMPGGYGQMTAILNLADARIPHPEFQLFSKVVITDGSGWFWIGEITDPEIGLNAGGEYISISALGQGNTLRDDLPTVIYSAALTIPFVAHDLLARWNYVNGSFRHTLRLDSDNSYLFPVDPGGTYSLAFQGKSFEEMYAQLCVLASSQNTFYDYAVWAHPLGSQPGGTAHKDAAGFPQCALYAQARDTATTHYQASVALKEVSQYKITPSGDRAYNYFEVVYNNGSNGTAIVHSTDTRLSGVLDQQTAPFPFRKLMRDYSGNPLITSSTAQGIAATMLATYQNPTNKVAMTLKAVRDGNGNPLPLWQVQAGKNVLVPEMAVRSIGALPTKSTAGVNQFFIVSAEYTETANTDAVVKLSCDNWVDRSAYQVARLQMAQDALLRSQQVGALTQIPGMPIAGQMGVSGFASGAGQNFGASQTFPQQATNVPTSVNVTATLQNNNATAVSISNITALGFHLKVSSVAGGQVDYVANYSTSGNCLLAVNATARTFDWHCDGCGHAWQGLAMPSGVTSSPLVIALGAPGHSTLTVTCPSCGHIEGFTTSLTSAAAADPTNTFRAQQAQLIRALMLAVGLEVA